MRDYLTRHFSESVVKGQLCASGIPHGSRSKESILTLHKGVNGMRETGAVKQALPSDRRQEGLNFFISKVSKLIN